MEDLDRFDAALRERDLATVVGRLGHGSGGKTTLAIYGHFLRGAPPDRAAADLLAGLVRPVKRSADDC